MIPYMLKNIFILTVTLLTSFHLKASEDCFIAKENEKIVKKIGKCDERHSPFSTFKLPIALMGFDYGILINSRKPLIKFSHDIEAHFIGYFDPVKYPGQLFSLRAQTPKTWMQYSVIWYSQYITQKLGMRKFQEYLNKLEYGNMNALGTPQKNDGLLNSWIRSSLKISPLEQVNFIEKLNQKNLHVSRKAQENTINIIKLEPIFDDWQLYGKTGGAMDMGWFVGWVKKKSRIISFAQYIEQPNTALISAGRIAKEVAKDNLISLIIQK